MASNKLLKKKSPRSVQDLVNASRPGPLSADELKKQVHRLEVEIAATSRLAAQRHVGRDDTLPPPETRRGGKGYAVQQRLTHVQSQRRRTRRLTQTAMFIVSSCLLAGAVAGLYRFWLQMQ